MSQRRKNWLSVFCLGWASILVSAYQAPATPTNDWIPALIIFILLVLLVAGALIAQRRQTPDAHLAPETEVPARSVAPSASDDLVIIEGIGPKIAAVLNEAGVVTFAQLAAMEPAKIEAILHDRGLRLADPTSWPDQARLAAAGDFDGLKVLQARLNAGRG